MPLSIQVSDGSPGTVRIALDGSLDSETTPELEKTLRSVAERMPRIAFDLQRLEFISSAGLRAIFATVKRQKAHGGEVALSNMSPGVRKVFEIVKALPDMRVFSSTEELDAYLAKFQ